MTLRTLLDNGLLRSCTLALNSRIKEDNQVLQENFLPTRMRCVLQKCTVENLCRSFGVTRLFNISCEGYKSLQTVARCHTKKRDWQDPVRQSFFLSMTTTKILKDVFLQHTAQIEMLIQEREIHYKGSTGQFVHLK